jgi:iron complex outermembrane receptor protein
MTSGSSFEAAAGCSGMLQSNENLGLEYLIPDYRSMDAGIFLTAKSSPGRSTFSGGLRFDTRSMRSESLMIEQDTVFNRLEKEFMAFTGSAGWSFSFNDRNSVKANFGKGFRAPTVSELSANGLHEGTFRYEVGNPALQPEVSYEFDAGVIHDRELFSVHADLFVGYIRDFIYYARSLNETRAVDGGIYPVYRYLQDNVVRQGGELTLDLHPWPALHFENSAAFVYAENRNTGRPLAFTPPARTTHELRYDFKSRSKKGNIYFNFSLDNVFAQNRIDEFETSTAGYLLLNAGAGFEGRIGKTGLRLFANLRNITNETYFDHLSRYKDISVNGPGRNLTTGVEIDF